VPHLFKRDLRFRHDGYSQMLTFNTIHVRAFA
jgi:hypothetical protein